MQSARKRINPSLSNGEWRIENKVTSEWSIKLCTSATIEMKIKKEKKGKYLRKITENKDKDMWRRMSKWNPKMHALGWKIRHSAYNHWIIGKKCEICGVIEDIKIDHILVGCKKLLGDEKWKVKLGTNEEISMVTLKDKRRDGIIDKDIIEAVDWGIALIRWQLFWKFYFKEIEQIPSIEEQEKIANETLRIEALSEKQESRKQEWQKLIN
jgi:hypothetical protein